MNALKMMSSCKSVLTTHLRIRLGHLASPTNAVCHESCNHCQGCDMMNLVGSGSIFKFHIAAKYNARPSRTEENPLHN